MTNKKPDVRAEHEKKVAEFNAQPAPDIWVCFYWPDLVRWQAIAAYEMHRPFVAEMRGFLEQARRGMTADPAVLAGDALNALAEMTLRQADAPRMGGLLLVVKDHFKHKYMFVTVKREHHGSTVTPREIPVQTLEQARGWVDAQPEIIASKAHLIESLLTGQKH